MICRRYRDSGVADFVVVLGADADLWFLPEEDPMRILGFPTPVGSVDITFRTRFAEEGYESPVPREMWIDVRGTSDMPLTDVVSAYGNAGAGFLPAIAFANNAYVATRTRRSATTRRRPQQPGGYFQSFTREEHGTVPRAGRCAESDCHRELHHVGARHCPQRPS